MKKKKHRVTKLSALERAALACFLAAFLGSLGMIGYSDVVGGDSLFWKFLLTSLISMMAGFLYGINKSK